ncbi:DUF2255 family protein [Pedobacter aquatilis]|uniref:DUF2255 family protein n=1 Tax=Pedobacter aquatilis TaxID=351343 RepID=UPI0029316925|nr:DUF2255 family protein [Pedobacter aquatilis]
MTNHFTTAEVLAIDKADDLKISPLRTDGISYGTPTWIWSVIVNGALYVRAYHGKKSSWYQAAISQQSGRIIAAGESKNVSFESIEGEINTEIDYAYRNKYSSSPYLTAMISEIAKASTIQIIPENKHKDTTNEK